MFVILTGSEAVVFDPNENDELLELFHEKGIKDVHILLIRLPSLLQEVIKLFLYLFYL